MARKIVINRDKSAAGKSGGKKKKKSSAKKPVKPIKKSETEDEEVVDAAAVTKESTAPQPESIALEAEDIENTDAPTKPVEVLDQDPDTKKLLIRNVREARKKKKKKKAEADPDEDTHPIETGDAEVQEAPQKAEPEAEEPDKESGDDVVDRDEEDTEVTPPAPEVFRFYCIRCGQKLKVRLSSVGKTQPCPSCKSQISVPEPLPEG